MLLGLMSSGQHDPALNAAPRTTTTCPVYIGLRVSRNGPAATSRETVWCGTTVVPWRRMVSTPGRLELSSAPPVVTATPAARRRGRRAHVRVTGTPGGPRGSRRRAAAPRTPRSSWCDLPAAGRGVLAHSYPNSTPISVASPHQRPSRAARPRTTRSSRRVTVGRRPRRTRPVGVFPRRGPPRSSASRGSPWSAVWRWNAPAL